MKTTKMVVAMLMCVGLTSCVLDGNDEPVEDPVISEVEQGLCHPALADCIGTALRDGNHFLIQTCIDVLCSN